MNGLRHLGIDMYTHMDFKAMEAHIYGGKYHGNVLLSWPHSHFASNVGTRWHSDNDGRPPVRIDVKQIWQKWLVSVQVFSPLMGKLVYVDDVIYVLDPLTPAAYMDEWLFDCFGVLRVEEGGGLVTINDVDRVLFMRGRRGNVDGPLTYDPIPSSHRRVMSERFADVRDRDHERRLIRPAKISFRPMYDRQPDLPPEAPEKDGATTTTE